MPEEKAKLYLERDPILRGQDQVVRLQPELELRPGRRVAKNRLQTLPRMPDELSRPLDDEVERLIIPEHQTFEGKSVLADVTQLVETAPVVSPSVVVEEAWGRREEEKRPVAYGWFILVGVLFLSAILWSFNKVRFSEKNAVTVAANAARERNFESEQDAHIAKTIDQMDRTARVFLAATSINDLAGICRDPDRVRPLMEDWYRRHSFTPQQYKEQIGKNSVQIDGRSYWVLNFPKLQGEGKQMLVDLNHGSPQIDWESFVVYQPMDWDEYVTSQPKGRSMDFRVRVKLENFNTYEFSDESRWQSFSMAAEEAGEICHGYVSVNSSLNQSLQTLIQQDPNKTASVILRLRFPENFRSPRSVLIEKIISPNWMILDQSPRDP
jgi:hypothetical protein